MTKVENNQNYLFINYISFFFIFFYFYKYTQNTNPYWAITYKELLKNRIINISNPIYLK